MLAFGLVACLEISAYANSFSVDPDTTPGRLVFNQTATFKDSWAKIEQKG